MGKHTLIMLTPWKENGQGPYYCPDCALVEGFLAYSPHVRDVVNIISVEFQRPRQMIVDLLGAENQDSPVLVLDETQEIPSCAQKSLTTGKAFINDPRTICEFLGEAFDAVRPHP
ncbi:MAG: DUF3088 domain-containing protein [Desulfobacterales bacterium]|nr:DUF3088 domain-containing protein [Desulfobacterales bacterium]